MPNFDSYLLAYHPRSTLIRDDVRATVFREQAWISAVVLMGGVAVGVWELERAKDRSVIRVEPFGRLPAGGRAAIRREAERVGEFVGLPVDVRFEQVTFLKRPGATVRSAEPKRTLHGATR